MKIIDQYVEAVGQKLPFKGRMDIKRELKSLLMDQLETECGDNPGEEDAKRIITDFGSPKEAAERYEGVRVPISSDYTEIYFLIIRIIPFALLVAFTVIFFLDLILQNLSGTALLSSLGRNLLNAFNGSLSGIGMVSLIFILVSRFGTEKMKEEEWSVKELESVVIEGEEESPAEIIVGITILSFLIVAVFLAPGLITSAENAFLKSGLPLGHRLNIEVFRPWSLCLVVIWTAEIIGQARLLKIGRRSKGFRIFEMVLSFASLLVLLLMINDRNLYLENTGYIGFRLIFLILLIVNGAELIGGVWRFISAAVRSQQKER